MWQRVKDYHAKLAVQREQKKARATSSSFLGFSRSIPVNLCELFASFENVIVAYNVSAASCSITFASSSPIVLAQPLVSLNVSLSDEPRWKRRRRRKNSEFSYVMKMEMWEQFEKYCSSLSQSSKARSFRSPKDHREPSSSSSHLAHRASPRRSPTAAHPFPPSLAQPSAPARLARWSVGHLPLWTISPMDNFPYE